MVARGEARAGPRYADAPGDQPRARGKGVIGRGRRPQDSTAAPQLALPGFPAGDRDHDGADYDPLRDGRLGETYSRDLDGPRLDRQLDRVRELMLDGRWRTIAEVSAATGASETGASARLRELRRPERGGYQVDRRRRGKPSMGLWEYHVAGGGQ